MWMRTGWCSPQRPFAGSRPLGLSYLSPFVTFIVKQKKKTAQHFQFISLGCCASDISPLLDNTERACIPWWFSFFISWVARQFLVTHPSSLCRPHFTAVIAVSKAHCSFFHLQGHGVCPCYFLSKDIRVTSSVLHPHCYFLPLHETKTCSMENTETAFVVVLNHTVIVFMSEGAECINSHELWVFLWEWLLQMTMLRLIMGAYHS